MMNKNPSRHYHGHMSPAVIQIASFLLVGYITRRVLRDLIYRDFLFRFTAYKVPGKLAGCEVFKFLSGWFSTMMYNSRNETRYIVLIYDIYIIFHKYNELHFSITGQDMKCIVRQYVHAKYNTVSWMTFYMCIIVMIIVIIETNNVSTIWPSVPLLVQLY